MQNKTLYQRLKPEYLDVLIANPKGLDFSLKQVKESLKKNKFFINLTVSDLDRLTSLLSEDITNNNIYKLFNNEL